MNELIESWEEGAGVREFVILTAQASDAHLEALSTIRTDEATVQVVDIFGLDFGPLLDQPARPIQGGELDTSLLLYLAPIWSAWIWRTTSRSRRRCWPATGRGTRRRLPAGSPGSVGYPQPRLRPKGRASV